jgi:hypothetical protein
MAVPIAKLCAMLLCSGREDGILKIYPRPPGCRLKKISHPRPFYIQSRRKYRRISARGHQTAGDALTNSVSGRSRTGRGQGFVGKHGRVMEVYLSSFTLLYISMCCAVISVRASPTVVLNFGAVKALCSTFYSCFAREAMFTFTRRSKCLGCKNG